MTTKARKKTSLDIVQGILRTHARAQFRDILAAAKKRKQEDELIREWTTGGRR